MSGQDSPRAMSRTFLIALIVGQLPCLHAAAACEAAGEECSAPAWQNSEQQALVQTKKLQLQKVSRHSSAPQDGAEDAGADEIEEPEMISARVPDHLAALQTSTLLDDLKVVLSAADSRASVSFMSMGQSHEYQMEAVSAYTAEANISIWTGSTWEYMHPGQTRTFRSMEDGKFASARINEDGSMSGLFERPDGHVLDIRPLMHDDSTDPAFALLQEYKGQGQAHISSLVTDMVELHSSTTATTTVHVPTLDEEIADTTIPPIYSKDEEKANIPHPKVGDSPHAPSAFNAGQPWSGTKWYPGCYKGDTKLHTMSIGFTVPPTIFRGGKSSAYSTVDKAKARWEEILAKGSFVYEKQMNIRLVLGDVKVAQQGGPAWALTSCRNDGWDGVQDYLNALVKSIKSKELPLHASWHTFVNCFGAYGVMGLGYVGTLCKASQGYNSGSDKFHSPASWITFTHELGHNFKGKHTFEEGQGKTGGIMDYGDGKLRGVYQFHTKYRRTEICQHLRDTQVCPAFREFGAPPPLPPNQRPPCVWKTYPGKYSGGYADGFSTSMTLEDAKAKCVELGGMFCGAVTCPQGKTTGCTVRASTDLKPGREDSYKAEDMMCCAKDCQAPPPGGAPAPTPSAPPPPAPPPGSGSGGGAPPAPPPGSGSGGGGGGGGQADSNRAKLESMEKRFEKIQSTVTKIEQKLR